MLLRYLAGPLIGAVIGYCTNYIAVKMLFYPRKEIYLFGHKLPFTPGAIPKGKARLAKAIARAVDEQLLTSEDIKRRIEAPETVEMVTEEVQKLTTLSVEEIGTALAGSEDGYETMVNQLTDQLTDQIMDSAMRLPIADIIVTEGSRIIKEKTAGTMLQMFINDSLIASITEPVSAHIEQYISENGRGYIDRELTEKMVILSVKKADDLLTDVGIDEEKQRTLIASMYQRLAGEAATKLLREINIAAMVEEKINAMEILELENLVLSVMKKELSMIVNLGALIGFVLGLVNLVL